MHIFQSHMTQKHMVFVNNAHNCQNKCFSFKKGAFFSFLFIFLPSFSLFCPIFAANFLPIPRILKENEGKIQTIYPQPPSTPPHTLHSIPAYPVSFTLFIKKCQEGRYVEFFTIWGFQQLKMNLWTIVHNSLGNCELPQVIVNQPVGNCEPTPQSGSQYPLCRLHPTVSFLIAYFLFQYLQLHTEVNQEGDNLFCFKMYNQQPDHQVFFIFSVAKTVPQSLSFLFFSQKLQLISEMVNNIVQKLHECSQNGLEHII